MLSHKLEATVSKGGTLNLRNLPFTEGDTVEVTILRPESAKRLGQRTVGEHVGKIRLSDDFNAPLPDDFWLGKAP